MSAMKRWLEDQILEHLEVDDTPPAPSRHEPLATGTEENRTP